MTFRWRSIEPTLIALVGAAGSGKSTLARRTWPSDWILSSDALRAELTGAESDQTRNAEVWRILHQRLAHRCAHGFTTVVDATNAQRHDRAALIRIARRHGIATAALILSSSFELCVARQSRRSRAVAIDVIRQQHDEIADARRQIPGEGWDHVIDVAVDEVIPAAVAGGDALDEVHYCQHEFDNRGLCGHDALPGEHRCAGHRDDGQPDPR